MKSNFNTPILLLIFNRPEKTADLSSKIKTIKPKTLFVAADGPRLKNNNDRENCQKARQIITDNIDWECDLHLLFREKNLGLGLAISSAISWFFANVTEGIILEDDCLPHEDFFPFCEELLERYREQKEIFMISGSCVPNKYISSTDADYLFTYIPSAWGWATWKRSWQLYDFELNSLKNFESKKVLEKIFQNKHYAKYWLNFFHEIKRRKINNWDYQLAFTSFGNKGLCIRPKINLVANSGATIINGVEKSTKKMDGLKIIKHPEKIEADSMADKTIMQILTKPLHKFKFFLKKIGIFYILKNLNKKL